MLYDARASLTPGQSSRPSSPAYPYPALYATCRHCSYSPLPLLDVDSLLHACCLIWTSALDAASFTLVVEEQTTPLAPPRHNRRWVAG